MDRLGTEELRRAYREFEATLTPTQRRFLAVGAVQSAVFTPEQLEILKKMEPHLSGLTPEQCRQLGVLDTFADGYEAGDRAGNPIVTMIAVGALLLIAAVALSLFVR